jgi:hypothetical protein
VETSTSEPAGRAIEAARAESNDERARVLVRLAQDLRRYGRSAVALRALDAACELQPSDEVRHDAYTCAIEAHCDLGQYIVAEVIEREQATRSVDDAFARAALRLYSVLSRWTGFDSHFARRAHYLSLIAGRSTAHR